MAASYEFEYDSAAVRAAARKLQNCANALSNGARPKISRLRGQLPENLQGEAGTALEAKLSEMNADVNTLVNGISGLSKALFKYAADLERTAQKLRGSM